MQSQVMSDSQDSITIVIFGASGDLTHRKLLPSLYASFKKGRLANCTCIVGFARRPYSDQDFRSEMHLAIEQYHPGLFEAGSWDRFSGMLHYVQGNFDNPQDFQRLSASLPTLEGKHSNRLYYLATAPEFYERIVVALGDAGLATQDSGWRRIVLEKPFGNDLQSAMALDKAVHAVFTEEQVYRIDHYLGKETAQNILFLRFANAIFEPLWNGHFIDHIQITVAETVDIGHRAEYYDATGVLRDMFQNHLLQLLALIAMEPPASFKAEAVRNEKVKLFQSIRPIALSDAVRGQYDGYLDTPGVAPGSQTPTFAALKLLVDNWRWQGVPFYLRSGKALAVKSTEIVVVFQCPPHLMFNLLGKSTLEPNVLSLCIQPDEGLHLQIQAKVPDTMSDMQPVELEFHYRDSLNGVLPDAYEVLLLDALEGDSSLFTRSDSIEVAWKLIDAFLRDCKLPGAPPVLPYTRGSWGPPHVTDELLARDGRQWLLGCLDHDRDA
jgi:glucose-6-phosphate 1-dehydrogenase